MADTGTVWLKNGWLKGELGADGYPVPGAIEPGIYVIDRETYRQFSLDPRIVRIKQERICAAPGTIDPGFAVGGATVRVATPEQAPWFEAQEAAGRGRELPDA